MILPQFFLKLKEKIAHGVLKTRDCLIATYDKGNASNNTLHSIYPLEQNLAVDLYYLLGIINSSLLNWYYRIVNYLEVGKTMAEVKGIYIKKLPMGDIVINCESSLKRNVYCSILKR